MCISLLHTPLLLPFPVNFHPFYSIGEIEPKNIITQLKNVNSRQNYYRSWQGSNLRSQRELDFKSNALTTRPQLLFMKKFVLLIFVFYCLGFPFFLVFLFHFSVPSLIPPSLLLHGIEYKTEPYKIIIYYSNVMYFSLIQYTYCCQHDVYFNPFEIQK